MQVITKQQLRQWFENDNKPYTDLQRTADDSRYYSIVTEGRWLAFLQGVKCLITFMHDEGVAEDWEIVLGE